MEADMPSVMGPLQHLRADLETKFDTGKTEGTFSGYAAVFGNVDSYGDVIERGAFKATLRAWEEKGKLPPMLLQHRSEEHTSEIQALMQKSSAVLGLKKKTCTV